MSLVDDIALQLFGDASSDMLSRAPKSQCNAIAAMLVLKHMPFCVPFAERVRLFRRLVSLDKYVYVLTEIVLPKCPSPLSN